MISHSIVSRLKANMSDSHTPIHAPKIRVSLHLMSWSPGMKIRAPCSHVQCSLLYKELCIYYHDHPFAPLNCRLLIARFALIGSCAFSICILCNVCSSCGIVIFLNVNYVCCNREEGIPVADHEIQIFKKVSYVFLNTCSFERA